MTAEERVEQIADRVDRAVAYLRNIRSTAKKSKQVDMTVFDSVAEAVASLRHNCERLNAEMTAN